MDSQPTKGTSRRPHTIEEKRSATSRVGRKCLVDGWLDKAETPTARALVHGFVLGCGRNGHAVRGGRLCGAFFPTGQGNVIGNPICR